MRALGAFAGGMGEAIQRGADRNERRAAMEMTGRYLDAMARNVANGNAAPDPYMPRHIPGGYSGGGEIGPLAPSNPSIGPAGGPVPRSRNALTGPAGGPAQNTARPSTRAGLFFDLMDRHEGGGRYDTLFGHSQREGNPFAGVDVSRMTLGQLREFASPSGEYGQWVRGQVGHVATPMGRYQIVGTTLRDAQRRLGLSDDTVFDRNTQDLIADDLARRAIQRGGINGLRSEWEGFRNVPDNVLQAAINEYMGQ